MVVHLSQPPEYGNYRHETPHSSWLFLYQSFLNPWSFLCLKNLWRHFLSLPSFSLLSSWQITASAFTVMLWIIPGTFLLELTQWKGWVHLKLVSWYTNESKIKILTLIVGHSLLGNFPVFIFGLRLTFVLAIVSVVVKLTWEVRQGFKDMHLCSLLLSFIFFTLI